LARSREQIEGRVERRLDLALTYSPPGPDSGLDARMLLREPFVLAGPEGHPALVDPSRVDPSALGGAAFIAPPAEAISRFRAEFLRAADAYGFIPDIRYEVAEEARLFAMAAAGAGLTLAQASMRRVNLPGLAFAELPGFRISVSLHFVWRRDEPCPLATRLRALALAEMASA